MYGNGDYPMYFFKGDLVYKLKVNTENEKQRSFYAKVEPGFPKKIASVFPNVPNNLDAAYRQYCSGINYFFKGKLYWRWNSTSGVAEGPDEIKKLIHDFCV